MRLGMSGSALDNWHLGTRINPDYDVNFYNIYSSYKSTGMVALEHGRFNEVLPNLQASLPYLEKCVAAPICHFKETWQKELDELKSWIANPMHLFVREENRLVELRQRLSREFSETKEEKRRGEITPSLNDIEVALGRVRNVLQSNPQMVEKANPTTTDSLLKSLLRS